jgi:hypothetical protein
MRFALILLVAGIASGLIGCKESAPLSASEKKLVNDLTGTMMPRCVGRYLIDLPVDALAFGRAEVQKVTFDAVSMSKDQYQDEIDSRSDTLRSTKRNDEFKYLLLERDLRGTDVRYFIRLKGEYGGNIGRIIEAYKWSDGFRIRLETKAYDVTMSSEKDNPAAQEIGNNVPEKTELVLDMLERVRGRAEDEIPSASGICFAGGFLPGKASDGEEVSASFFLKGKEDVSFELKTYTDIVQSNTLLQRGEDINEILKNTEGGRTIRKGRVELSGMQAEEWLSAGMTPSKVQGNFLTLEANSQIGSAKTPLIILDMDNGLIPSDMQWGDRPKKASLTEGEAVALWDAVSRTLRPRYNGF